MTAAAGDTHRVSNRRWGGRWPWVFGVHVALVLGLSLLFGIVTDLGDDADGANVGAVILLLPLLPLGLPWSLPLIIEPYRFDSVAPAVLNVVIHGLLLVSFLVVRARHRARLCPRGWAKPHDAHPSGPGGLRRIGSEPRATQGPTGSATLAVRPPAVGFDECGVPWWFMSNGRSDPGGLLVAAPLPAGRSAPANT